MNEELKRRLREFFDKLTDEELRGLFLVLCVACEIVREMTEDEDGQTD